MKVIFTRIAVALTLATQYGISNAEAPNITNPIAEATRAEITAVLAAARAAADSAGAADYARVVEAVRAGNVAATKEAGKQYCKSSGLAWNSVMCPYQWKDARRDIAEEKCRERLEDWIVFCETKLQ